MVAHSDYPIKTPLITGVLLDAIHEANELEGRRPKAFDTITRYSDAAKCSRAIAFDSMGVELTNPPDLAGEWVMWLGSVIHEHLQRAVLEKFGKYAMVEVTSRIGDIVSGHADAVISIPYGGRRDDPIAIAAFLEEIGLGQGNGLLDLDWSDNRPAGQEDPIWSDGAGRSGPREHAGAPGVLRDVHRADSTGPGDRPSVSSTPVRLSEAPGGRDSSGESQASGSGGDSLPEGSRVHPGEHVLDTESQWRSEPRVSDVQALPDHDGQTGAPSGREGWFRIAVEWKTSGAFGFDQAVGLNRKAYDRKNPAGPRASAKLQGALNAVALDCDLLVIGMISMEAVSKQLAEKVGFADHDRIMGEWHYDKAEFGPWAQAELARMDEIAMQITAGVLPGPVAIGDEMEAITLNPHLYRQPWQCSYCSHLDTCLRVPV